MKQVTDKTFENDVLNNPKPVLVDFFAEWCGPCKQLAATLHKLEPHLPEIEMVQLDIDQNPDVSIRYGIRSVPTMLLFMNGKVESTKIGTMSESGLRAWLSDWNNR